MVLFMVKNVHICFLLLSLLEPFDWHLWCLHRPGWGFVNGSVQFPLIFLDFWFWPTVEQSFCCDLQTRTALFIISLLLPLTVWTFCCYGSVNAAPRSDGAVLALPTGIQRRPNTPVLLSVWQSSSLLSVERDLLTSSSPTTTRCQTSEPPAAETRWLGLWWFVIFASVKSVPSSSLKHRLPRLSFIFGFPWIGAVRSGCSVTSWRRSAFLQGPVLQPRHFVPG